MRALRATGSNITLCQAGRLSASASSAAATNGRRPTRTNPNGNAAVANAAFAVRHALHNTRSNIALQGQPLQM